MSSSRRAVGAVVVLLLSVGALYACVGDSAIPSSGTDDGGGGSDGGGNTADGSMMQGTDGSMPADDSGTDAGEDAGLDAGPVGPVYYTRVFVSSMKYFGDSIGGLDGGDQACQVLATAAGLFKTS